MTDRAPSRRGRGEVDPIPSLMKHCGKMFWKSKFAVDDQREIISFPTYF